jgi:hypothetical protein
VIDNLRGFSVIVSGMKEVKHLILNLCFFRPSGLSPDSIKISLWSILSHSSQGSVLKSLSRKGIKLAFGILNEGSPSTKRIDNESIPERPLERPKRFMPGSSYPCPLNPPADDGLISTWGNDGCINPPYGPFCRKAFDQRY